VGVATPRPGVKKRDSDAEGTGKRMREVSDEEKPARKEGSFTLNSIPALSDCYLYVIATSIM